MENSDILASIDLDAIKAEIVDWGAPAPDDIRAERLDHGAAVGVAVSFLVSVPMLKKKIPKVFAARTPNRHATTENFAAILAHRATTYFKEQEKPGHGKL